MYVLAYFHLLRSSHPSRYSLLPTTGPTRDHTHRLPRPSLHNQFYRRKRLRDEDPCARRGGGGPLPGVAERDVPGDGRQDIQESQEGTARDESEDGVG